jgi:hypothetical protein
LEANNHAVPDGPDLTKEQLDRHEWATGLD